MSAPPRVVPIGPASAPEMFALHAPLFDPPWSAESIAGQLREPSSFALAVWGEALEGFVLCRTAADEAEILIIAVAEHAQSRGLGRALMAAALRTAEAAGARSMWLEVAVDNGAALRLYDGLGFEEAGRRRRYYNRSSGERVDALLFRRALGEDRLTGPLQSPMITA